LPFLIKLKKHSAGRVTPAGSLVLVQDRFWGNMVSYFACDIPQFLSDS
jgi:hypothetical protein